MTQSNIIQRYVQCDTSDFYSKPSSAYYLDDSSGLWPFVIDWDISLEGDETFEGLSQNFAGLCQMLGLLCRASAVASERLASAAAFIDAVTSLSSGFSPSSSFLKIYQHWSI